MRVIFLGSPVAPPQSNLSAAEKFEHSWFNTGNLAIGSAILRELVVTDYAAAPWPEQLALDPAEANEKYDQIVVPAFNFLYRGFDFSRFSDFVEKTALPCVMIGVGAQAPSPDAFDFDIPQGTRRLLSVASERSKSIGVRGEFSADVMGRLGYKNLSLIGCPSLYRSLAPKISVPRRQRSSSDPLRVVVNGSRNVSAHSFAPEEMSAFEAQIIDLAIDRGWPYILQNEQPELDIVLREGEATYQDLADLDTLTRRLSLKHGPGDWLQNIQGRYHIFFNIERWEKFLKLFDFSLGTRLHGAILALTSGVPALLIKHDTRTSEMAELCRLPHLKIDDVKNVDVDNLYDELDLSDFENRYSSLYTDYVDFLDQNNLRHKLASGAVENLPRNESPDVKGLVRGSECLSWDRMIENAKVASELAAAKTEIEHLISALATGQAVIDERGVRIAELEADLSDKVEKANEALAKSRAIIDEQDVRIAELEAAKEFNAEAATTSQAEVARLIKSIASVTAWGHEASHKFEMAQQTLRDVQNQLAQVSGEKAAILTSTSWQTAKPLRAISSRLPASLRRFIRRSLRVMWWIVTFRLFDELRQRRYRINR
jgi:hypothetical protein